MYTNFVYVYNCLCIQIIKIHEIMYTNFEFTIKLRSLILLSNFIFEINIYRSIISSR